MDVDNLAPDPFKSWSMSPGWGLSGGCHRGAIPLEITENPFLDLWPRSRRPRQNDGESSVIMIASGYDFVLRYSAIIMHNSFSWILTNNTLFERGRERNVLFVSPFFFFFFFFIPPHPNGMPENRLRNAGGPSNRPTLHLAVASHVVERRSHHISVHWASQPLPWWENSMAPRSTPKKPWSRVTG